MQETRFRIDSDTELIVCHTPGDGFEVWIATEAPATGFDPYAEEKGPMSCYCVGSDEGRRAQASMFQLEQHRDALSDAIAFLRTQTS